jgi:4'-phosphopantetheinyl transferase
VHLWRAELAGVAEEVIELLSDDERARVARFSRKADGALWGRSRGVLRELLGRYLGVDPRSLVFAAEAHGKPVLRRTRSDATRLPWFNLAHSGGMAVYAFSTVGPVGVDIELDARERYTAGLATRAFGAAAAELLQRLEPPAREEEFLRMWVRHEATLKCLGTGLGAGAAPEPELWVAELDIGPRVAGVLALQMAPSELRCWTWPDAAGGSLVARAAAG